MAGAPVSGGLFERKSVEEAVAETERGGYHRALGPLDLTAVGVAGIIGAGIFFLLGLEARGTGPAVMLSILYAGAAAVLAAFSYAEFASLLPGSGSAYAYAFASLGRLPAFLMGWTILNSYAVGNMTVAVSWSGFVRSGLAGVGVSLPPALSAPPGEGGVVNLPAVVIVLLVTVLTLPRIRESTQVNNLLVALKLLIVLFVIALGAFLVQPRNWEPFSPGGPEAVIGSTAILFFAYLGFDTVAATGEESRNPRRDLPLGIVLSVGISMLLYLAMAAVVTGMTAASEMPADEPPVPAGFSRLGFPWAGALITGGAIVALGTVIYAFHLALSRILVAMARDGFLPEALGRLRPGTGTPWTVSLIVGLLTALGAAFLELGPVLDMAVLAAIAMYVFVSVGVLLIRWFRPDLPRRFTAPWPVHVVGVVLLVGIAARGLPWQAHYGFFQWTMLGLVVYGFYAHRRSVRVSRTRTAP